MKGFGVKGSGAGNLGDLGEFSVFAPLFCWRDATYVWNGFFGETRVCEEPMVGFGCAG